MSDDASRLSELTGYVDEHSTLRYLRTNDFFINEDGTWTISMDGEKKKFVTTKSAVRNLAKILGVPVQYLERVPVDLASYNLEYLLARNDEGKLAVSISDDNVISEVSKIGDEIPVSVIIKAIAEVFGDVDPYIIQSKTDLKGVSFVALYPDEIDTEIGTMHKGIYASVSTDTSISPEFAPVYGDVVEETIVGFHELVDEAGGDDWRDSVDGGSQPENIVDSIKSSLSHAIEMIPRMDEIISGGKDVTIDNFTHFVDVVGGEEHVSKPTKKKLFTELQNLQDKVGHRLTASDVCRAVMTTQEITKPEHQVVRLAMLAGRAFTAKDPSLCPTCHRELDEDGNHLPAFEGI